MLRLDIIEALRCACTREHSDIVELRERTMQYTPGDSSRQPGRSPQEITHPLQWPRPVLIPRRLIPQLLHEEARLAHRRSAVQGDHDHQDRGSDATPRAGGRGNQSLGDELSLSWVPAEADYYWQYLWRKRSYRFRCFTWYVWRAYVKDWYDLLKYPTVAIGLLTVPTYYVIRIIDILMHSD